MTSASQPTAFRQRDSGPAQPPPGDRSIVSEASQRESAASNADWDPVWRQGLGLWVAITAGLVVLPAGHPAAVGLLASGILAAPTVPVGLYFAHGDELRARLDGAAAAGRRVLDTARKWTTTSRNDPETGCSGCRC